MKDKKEREEQFCKGSLPVRLKALATDVRRIHDLVRDPAGKVTVETLLDDIRGYVEWIVTDALAIPRAGVELANLYRDSTSWLHIWREEALSVSLQLLLKNEMHAWEERLLDFAEAASAGQHAAAS